MNPCRLANLIKVYIIYIIRRCKFIKKIPFDNSVPSGCFVWCF